MFSFLRHRTSTPAILDMAPSASLRRDPKNEFIEIYGGALVAQRRSFVLSLLLGLLAVVSVGALWHVSRSRVAIPWLVEVNQSGVVSRPVRLERLTPPQAVLKAELARWAERVYSIDPRQTPEMLRLAHLRTRGKAIEQFREFRIREDIIARMASEPDFIRVATVSAVDVSQNGLAFVYLSTTESRGSHPPANPRSYRITLHYVIDPPTTEAEIFANPLGLYVSFFSPTQERR
ncbi:MAG: type IV secretion system protein [Burkholderiaceae bacterium]|nr:type IV secretion system protein [Burkholderiaceae bacterium]